MRGRDERGGQVGDHKKWVETNGMNDAWKFNPEIKTVFNRKGRSDGESENSIYLIPFLKWHNILSILYIALEKVIFYEFNAHFVK